jgi:hypothetical protein
MDTIFLILIQLQVHSGRARPHSDASDGSLPIASRDFRKVRPLIWIHTTYVLYFPMRCMDRMHFHCTVFNYALVEGSAAVSSNAGWVSSMNIKACSVLSSRCPCSIGTLGHGLPAHFRVLQVLSIYSSRASPSTCLARQTTHHPSIGFGEQDINGMS